jgi:2,3-bisphosphoglycerate-dependent phosphoglycerate mutase
MAELILVRHGQSIWNQSNQFTGWIDVPLTQKGRDEAKHAGELLKEKPIDIAYTSTLIRAHQTLFTILEENRCHSGYYVVHEEEWYGHLGNEAAMKGLIPVVNEASLNERYYGDLQGRDKEMARKEFGEEQVHIWRRSFSTPPPDGESLKGTTERTQPFFQEVILPQLRKGKTILIAAHHNSLRSIAKYLERISDDDIPNFEMGTGVPRVYEMDESLKIKNVYDLD